MTFAKLHNFSHTAKHLEQYFICTRQIVCPHSKFSAAAHRQPNNKKGLHLPLSHFFRIYAQTSGNQQTTRLRPQQFEYLFISPHAACTLCTCGFLQSERPFSARPNMVFGTPKHSFWQAQTWSSAKTGVWGCEAKNIATRATPFSCISSFYGPLCLQSRFCTAHAANV